jgi:tetratricopeptide (TPR) repeat protein
VSLIKVGDGRRSGGDRAGALAAYEESLAIMRKLAAADPGNAGWQRDVGVGLERIGDLQLAGGDAAGALGAYGESLAIMRRLAAADPGSTLAQRNIGVALTRIGDARLAGGDRAGALAAYEESLRVARRLLVLDRGSVGWQVDLVVSLYKLSAVVDPPRARAALREALALAEMLARGDKLTAAQQDLPRRIGDALAKLPPEQAEARCGVATAVECSPP